MRKRPVFTVADMIEELAERLLIDLMDGDLTVEEEEIFARVLDEIRENGMVKLTGEQLAMPAEDFIAECIRRCNAS